MLDKFEFVLSADEIQTIRIGLDRYIDNTEKHSEDWNDAMDVWEVLDAGTGKYGFSDIQVDILLGSLDYVGYDRANGLFGRIWDERNAQCVGA